MVARRGEGVRMNRGSAPHSADHASVAALRDERLTVVLSSRRASLVFVAIVFVTTFVQVVSNPLAFALQEGSVWTFALPMQAVAALLIAGTAAQAAALLLGARWPGLAILGTLAAYLGLVFAVAAPSWLSSMQLVVAVALFLLASQRGAIAAVVWWLVIVGISLAALWFWVVSIGTAPGLIAAFLSSQVVALATSAAGAGALGVWWGVQSRRVRRAREDAEAARREHDERVARAQEEERARIAQELHDVAGQHLSGLLALADAAVSVGSARPETMLQLVEDVRAEGRFAAASLYGALAELRAAEGVPVEVTRDLRRVTDLVDYWRRRGTALTLRVLGELGDLPAVVSTMAYRGVQEALTNAAKHAPGADVEITLIVDDEQLRAIIENGPAAPAREAGERIGLGWGLSGLRDRIGLIGGSVVAGPTPRGGWKVELRAPAAGYDTASRGPE